MNDASALLHSDSMGMSIRHVTIFILKSKLIFFICTKRQSCFNRTTCSKSFAFRATNAFCSNTVKQAPHDANNTLNLIDSNNNKKSCSLLSPPISPFVNRPPALTAMSTQTRFYRVCPALNH